MTRILFADDQIPDEAIPDEEVVPTLTRLHPEWSPSFVDAFPEVRKVVGRLRAAGHEVTPAWIYQDALNHARRTPFDIAIVDLGWDGDAAVPRAKMRTAGYDLARELRAISPRTMLIMYTSRFTSDPGISTHAAQQGLLPVLKSYDQIGCDLLLAAIRFIEQNLLLAPSPQERLAMAEVELVREQMVARWKDSQRQMPAWFWLTVVSVAVALAIVAVGVLLAVTGSAQVGTVTAINGIITAFISGTLYTQMSRIRRDQTAERAELEKALAQAYARLGAAKSSATVPTPVAAGAVTK